MGTIFIPFSDLKQYYNMTVHIFGGKWHWFSMALGLIELLMSAIK